MSLNAAYNQLEEEVTEVLQTAVTHYLDDDAAYANDAAREAARQRILDSVAQCRAHLTAIEWRLGKS